MELKEALRILDHATREEALAVYGGDCAMRTATVEEACRVVCAYVREHLEAEKNEPLTLAELREMSGKPVWIVDGLGDGHWELSEDAEDYFYGRDESRYDRSCCNLLGWRAYRRPPESAVT